MEKIYFDFIDFKSATSGEKEIKPNDQDYKCFLQGLNKFELSFYIRNNDL